MGDTQGNRVTSQNDPSLHLKYHLHLKTKVVVGDSYGRLLGKAQ